MQAVHAGFVCFSPSRIGLPRKLGEKQRIYKVHLYIFPLLHLNHCSCRTLMSTLSLTVSLSACLNIRSCTQLCFLFLFLLLLLFFDLLIFLFLFLRLVCFSSRRAFALVLTTWLSFCHVCKLHCSNCFILNSHHHQ